MKKIMMPVAVAVLFFISCKGNSYTMETTYKATKTNGDSTMTTRNQSISADSDSLAYIKANEEFNKLPAKENSDGMPFKFLVKNSKGVVVPAPGIDTSADNNKLMYPNQKSPN